MRPMNLSSARSASAIAALLTLLSCTGAEFDQSATTTVNIETTAMQPSEVKADGTAKSDDAIASKTNRLPPIDTEAPTDFQTATFALG